MLCEPCLWKIIINDRVNWMSFHTDDCDGLAEDPRDATLIYDEFDKKYGVTHVDPRFMLGVQRETTVKQGLTRIHLSQPGYLDKVWDKFKHLRAGRRVPSTPFPPNEFLSGIDPTTRKPLEVPKSESNEAYETGFMELTGSLLWAARNGYPGASFMLGFNAGFHCLHYLWAHREDGIEFNSEGNREPIGFYDSSHNQDLVGFKSQYGFIIYWMGGPILWASKQHKQHSLSVSEDEYMACLPYTRVSSNQMATQSP